MIHVHYANRLESLAGMLVQRIASEPVDVLEPEIVVVQGPAMGRWLTLWMAQNTGICANVRFPLAAGFIWDMFRSSLPEMPPENGYEPAVMTWRLMSTLDELQHRAEFAPVRNWLMGGDEARRYELAVRLAETFDQYLVYRPDWIRAWEAGQDPEGLDVAHAAWQGTLWRTLASSVNGPHWVEAWERFVDAPAEDLRVPRRVSLFGLPTLSPGYLDVLDHQGENCEVELYVVNPCREYWSDIVSRRALAGRAGAGDVETSCFETGNALLASLGGQGAEFIDMLQDLHAQEDASYGDPGTGSLLGAIQSDILNLRERDGDDVPSLSIGEGDRSLSIHVCHGAMREVEVLHDELLAMFEQNEGLSPEDVAVLTPDFTAFAPLIETVFGGAGPERRIPFGLGSAETLGEHPLISALDTLLDVSSSRFEADIVLGLLDEPAIRRRFGLEEADLERVHELVREAGIRWGVDARSRAAEGLPELPGNTWRAGLDRLVLGYAMGGEGEGLFSGILPCGGVEGSDAQIAGSLCRFAGNLFELRDRLSGDRTIVSWVSRIRSVLADFFLPDDEDESSLQGVREALEALETQALAAAFDGPVPLAVVRSALGRHLGSPAGIARAFSGGVPFGGLSAIRGIPRKVICLLGMNDGVFPHIGQVFDFDLMKDDHRRGDRSRRDDDRYLFLETLLSARERLYISYSGRDMHDNAVLPPSTVVSELLDAVDRGWEMPDGRDPVEAITTVHPLQPFSLKVFSGEAGYFSYDNTLLEATRASLAPAAPAPFIGNPLPTPDEGEDWRQLPLAELESFFLNPVRYLLRRRLGIRLEEGAEPVESAEPFKLDWFGMEAVRRELVGHAWDGVPPEESYGLCRARGLLPHGNVGRHDFDAEVAGVNAILPRLAPWRDDLEGHIDVGLTVAGVALTGRIFGAGQQGLTVWQPVKLSARHYLQLWFRHLVLRAAGSVPAGRESRFVAEDGTLLLRPVEGADLRLASLLEIFEEGMSMPLPFFPKSSLAYAQAAARARSDPLLAARKIWNADPRRGWPESANPFYQLVFGGTDPLDDRFAGLSQAVFGPILAHAEVVR
ncbi:MAG: exodeoxyribonuclease V subunit gamma [Pseudomonadota bacterium]|nr:exodeoxyribonuclease V subunit gamma [Pseudomonadota bacterium]